MAALRRNLYGTIAVLALGALPGGACGSGPSPVVLSSSDATVTVSLDPFSLTIGDGSGKPVLETLSGGGDDAYGGVATTVDVPTYSAQLLEGWDEYAAGEGPFRHATRATVASRTAGSVTLSLTGDGDLAMKLVVSLDGARVHLSLDAPPNKTTMSFHSTADEHFFGMGERFGTVDHRGWSLYSWAEEGGLGQGENTPVSDTNPYPHGPSMTYFPVPFFLSSHGYGVHLETTFRTEVHFASERDDAWRFAVEAPAWDATVYVHHDPLATLDDYTADTGRPLVPAPWVFGARRRVGDKSMVNGVPEWQAMRQNHVPITGMDDSVHFLPALSQTGREAELQQWTATAHAEGYKVMAYNNPYVAANNANAAADYAYGLAHGYFVKNPDGTPVLNNFISGTLLQVSPIDLTNPDAVTWFQSLLQRTLDLGYDGWMHDFGEYTPHDAVFFDGRRGDEMHDEYPVLSAKAAHDLLVAERPNDFLFFVRSGYAGTQAYVPAVWGGDAEATFDTTQGIPSVVRGGVNLSMSGVPYWGSDGTGFKCLTSFPHDKEMFLRWVEIMAASPMMMEDNACSNPIQGTQPKWSLWSDAETTTTYARWARLHTRLAPYFWALAERAHSAGTPLTMHPFLLFPDAPQAWSIEDAYYLGPALYVWPVVARGGTEKHGWMPPGRYVDLNDFRVYAGGAEVSVPAPLDDLPIFLVEGQIVPMLESVDRHARAGHQSGRRHAGARRRPARRPGRPRAGRSRALHHDRRHHPRRRAPHRRRGQPRLARRRPACPDRRLRVVLRGGDARRRRAAPGEHGARGGLGRHAGGCAPRRDRRSGPARAVGRPSAEAVTEEQAGGCPSGCTERTSARPGEPAGGAFLSPARNRASMGHAHGGEVSAVWRSAARLEGARPHVSVLRCGRGGGGPGARRRARGDRARDRRRPGRQDEHAVPALLQRALRGQDAGDHPPRVRRVRRRVAGQRRDPARAVVARPGDRHAGRSGVEPRAPRAAIPGRSDALPRRRRDALPRRRRRRPGGHL